MDPLRANEFFIQARKGWEKGASFFFFFLSNHNELSVEMLEK